MELLKLGYEDHVWFCFVIFPDFFYFMIFSCKGLTHGAYLFLY
jgi:hypothetical protein